MPDWGFEPNEIKSIKKGTILRGSWGYDQTNNEYCQVVKNTGKTLICQKLGKKTIGDIYPALGSKVMPDKNKKVCKPFRIKIDRYTGQNGEERVSLHGATPLFEDYCDDKPVIYWGRLGESYDIDTER